MISSDSDPSSFQTIFSASLQVTGMHICSVNSCNFGVAMEGGELSVFLLGLVGHTPVYFSVHSCLFVGFSISFLY